MRTTCLINNYNYRQYLLDAIESALRQTLPFNELILVDDGSTDGSMEAVLSRFGDQPELRVIGKANEGQLSCFQVGWEASTGDIVFFLDADDTYEPNYVEETLAIYEVRPDVDFVFSRYREFGEAATQVQARDVPDQDLGCSLIPTLFTGQWIGAPTSCVSMRRKLLAKILPVPMWEDWRIRADDCLVLGASLVCGTKYQQGKSLINYRLHGRNGYAGVPQSPLAQYTHRVAVNRLIKMFCDRMGYDVDSLANNAHREFRTMERTIPWKRLERYAKVVWRSRLRWTRKLALLADMSSHFAVSWTRPWWDGVAPVAGQGIKATLGEDSPRRRAA